MIDPLALRNAVPNLPLSPVTSVWYRAVGTRYAVDPLRAVHSPLYPSRYKPGPAAATPFQTLYLAEDPLVAMFEVRALLGDPAA